MDDDKTHRQDPDSTETVRQRSPTRSDRIGNYRILEKIGEGGMGEVWLAEQTEPVKRKVALKVIKRGLDTKQVIARFEAERQALAMMDHPAIAKVYEAGSTPRGRPYFAMEYVQGIPITEHCDRHKLTTAQRLELFREVCEGVQHAHHKAVIHRDLKPSNVLVTIRGDRPAPKIIDFGVAKATAQKLTDETLHTQLGVMIGTPAYMSPEQADLTRQDIDTRSDVYSLGVMLYELLIGALPFDMKEMRQAGFEAMVRRIREDDPPRPSTRLSTLGEQSTESARLRRVDLRALRRELAGDLDWITMKALEKDRTRRYGSPEQLAADLARHVAHQPVLAGPPSASYRARKFVQRHLVGVSFAMVVLLLLSGFAATMTVQTQRIARERDRANDEAETANRVSEVMNQILAIPDPGGGQGAEVTMLEVLDRGVQQIERGLKDEPLIRARMMSTMGRTYGNLELFDQAQALLEQAVEIQEQQSGPGDAAMGDTLFELGFLHYEKAADFRGSYEEALDYWKRTLEVRRAALPPDHPDLASTLTHLGWASMHLGDRAEAELHAREAQRFWESFPDRVDWRAAHNDQLLAWIAEENGDMKEALAMADRSIELFDRAAEAGKYWPPKITTLDDAVITYRVAGRLEKSLEISRRVVEYREGLFGRDHPSVISVFSGISRTLLMLGEVQSAYEYQRRFMEHSEADPELEANYRLLRDRLQLGLLAMLLDRTEEARTQYLGALNLFRDGVAVPTMHEPIHVKIPHDLATLVAQTGENEDALLLFEIASRTAGRYPSEHATIHRDWAVLLRRMGRDAEAAVHELRADELATEVEQSN